MTTAPDGRTILEISNRWHDNHAHLDLLVDALVANGNSVKKGWIRNRDGATIRVKNRIDWDMLNQLFVIPDEVVYQDRGDYNTIWCERTYNEIVGGQRHIGMARSPQRGTLDRSGWLDAQLAK